MVRFRVSLTFTVLISIAVAGLPSVARANFGSFIGPFNTVSTIAPTVPANGDVNPYGVAVVSRSVGNLIKGDVLVSNFNDSANLQGTGTTIVEVAPGGAVSLFARLNPATLPGPCPGGVGLTTALVTLQAGWVIVGSLPTSDGTSATAQAGCLIVLDSMGRAVKTLSGPLIDGPWDMTAVDRLFAATLFVTNVLNGTVAGSPNVVNRGTVVRIELTNLGGRVPLALSETVVGSGFPERTDPSALVIGPTGLGLGPNRVLYVADSLDNRIAAIPGALGRLSSAGIGLTVSTNGSLNDPLGLAIAPNGDILTVNGGDGNIVETTPQGAQVAETLLDSTGSPPGNGTLFGLSVVPGGQGAYFVDDGTNTLNLLH